MKIIRSSVFETNSSSAHSLVLNKESKVFENYDKYDTFSLIFGTTYSEIWNMYDYDWDGNGNKIYNKRDYEFNFCRGKVRIYDDFIHKTAFLSDYYRYKNKDIFNHILKYSSDTSKKYLDKYDYRDSDSDILKELIKFYIDKEFKREKKKLYELDSYIVSEFSSTSNLIEKICSDDNLLDNFLFNSKSYISISGDEYECSYLKLVGSKKEYDNYYDYEADKSNEEFERRVKEVYPEDKYDVDYGI